MFGSDVKSMTAALAEMQRRALEQANFSQTDARSVMAKWLAHDRRFDEYDQERLVKRVQECIQSAAHLDLDDPFLRKGGERRPLDRRTAG